ncbi:MAG TPA: PQQ-binding-like beta-propeller repeat protein [Planctomycetota bacterium]|nr:PQQ-binding-like beta-propeller repeat protein [Planctomycetota bacterium]
MNRRSVFGVAAVTAATLCAALAEDWPTVAHDNQRTGRTAERLAPPLSVRWVFEPPFPPAKGWALPVNGYGARKNKPNVSYDDALRVIAAGDACYFASSAENRLYALDAATGAVRWTAFADAAPRLAPAFWQGRLYVGADDGVLRCLDARTGELVWRLDAAPRPDLMLGQGRFGSVWPIRSGGIVEDGIVYFTAGLFPQNGLTLFAARADDGKLLWRRRLDDGGRTDQVPQGYILSTADSLFTPSRIEPARWSKRDGSPIDFTTPFPTVKDAHEYRFYNGGSDAQVWNGRHIVYGVACILAYDPDKDWKDKWGKPKKGELLFNWFNARQVVFSGDMAYLTTDYYVAAVRQSLLPDLAANECKEFEEAYKSLRIPSYLDHLGRYEWLVRERGENSPEARALRDGPLKWGRAGWEKWPAASEAVFAKLRRKCAWTTPLAATEALVLAGDVLYAGGDDAVHALDATSGKELWSLDTGSRVRGLAVAHGRLFVSTIDGTIRCLAAGPAPEKPARAAVEPPEPPAIAKQIIERSGVRRGYCLLLGAGDGRLAAALARFTDLTIEVVEPDAAKVAVARKFLAAARLYGGRVCVRQAPLDPLPYAPYLFNLVVDLSAPPLAPLAELLRVTRPCGGVALLDARAAVPGALLQQFNATAETGGGFVAITRGRIPGTRDWTHNYATPANTYCSEDPLVRGPFGVLWYGEPGPRDRIERHATPPVPLVVNGILFTIGYDRVMAYDVYNGLRRWEREIPGATRQRLPINTSNMAADEKALYLIVNDAECLRLDARTGETTRSYKPPPREGGEASAWAWLAREGTMLYGSRRPPDRRQRDAWEQTSDAVFALDADTGGLAWLHEAEGIDHDGIALGDGQLFLVARALTDAERQQALADTPRDASVPDRKAVDRKGQPVAPDLRKLVALDAATGRLVWTKPWNVTDITLDDAVVQGRVGVACMCKDGVLVVHGTGSLGHPHKEFLAGEFARRALVAFDARTGKFLWGGRKGYRKRPIIVGDCVYAEPFAWHLRTGAQRMVPNPLSGQPQALDFHRGYIGCGHLLASGAAIFGARGGIACWNLDEQAGFTPFAGMALACGICAAPANGVLAVPEGRSGCTCPTPILTSIAFYPKPDAEAWGLGFSGGLAKAACLPVRRLSVNLGAPGYRQDRHGNLWVPYPARRDAGPLAGWLPTYQHDDRMCYRLDELLTPIAGTDIPWVYTSGYAADKSLAFRLLDGGAAPAAYTVRLHFAEPEGLAPGQRVFSVVLQGKVVLADFDIVKEAGGPRRALVKEFRGIEVKDFLRIQLRPSDGAARGPALCGVQAVRE